MNKFHIKFYCGTDLRTDYIIEAPSDILALAAALTRLGMVCWVETYHDRIEITRD